jgi:hypothetical protein
VTLVACRDRRTLASMQKVASPVAAPLSDTTFKPVTWEGDIIREDSASYFYSVLDAVAGGERPRMGWFLPSLGFLAEERYPAVFVLSADSTILQANFAKVISAPARDSIARRENLACGDRGPLAAYSIASIPQYPRALYLSRSLPGARVLRGRALPLTSEQVRDAHRRLAIPVPALYRDTALGTEGDGPYYSLHAGYDSATQALLGSVLLLHSASGEVIGRALNDTTAFECDGCELPSFGDGLGFLYRVVNVFSVPGFKYPLLLLDTSTMEGRALSLVTFTPGGHETEYRIYEYVVNCILGDSH